MSILFQKKFKLSIRLFKLFLVTISIMSREIEIRMSHEVSSISERTILDCLILILQTKHESTL
jgi:hypothetical protein